MSSPLERIKDLKPILGLGPEVWRVLAKCHEHRNLAEYQGELDIDERLVMDLLSACDAVRVKVEGLPPLA